MYPVNSFLQPRTVAPVGRSEIDIQLIKSFSSINNVILTNVSSTDIQVVVTDFSSGALIVHAIGIGPGIALVADWEVNWNISVQKIIIGASLKSRASSPR